MLILMLLNLNTGCADTDADLCIQKWERDPYVVIEKPVPDIPGYRFQKESGSDKIRTLHRNLLLPYTCISNSENTGVP